MVKLRDCHAASKKIRDNAFRWLQPSLVAEMLSKNRSGFEYRLARLRGEDLRNPLIGMYAELD
jgi:hypothetical protein